MNCPTRGPLHYVALAREPTDTVYDMREMECLDPDGHRICFGQELR